MKILSCKQVLGFCQSRIHRQSKQHLYPPSHKRNGKIARSAASPIFRPATDVEGKFQSLLEKRSLSWEFSAQKTSDNEKSP